MVDFPNLGKPHTDCVRKAAKSESGALSNLKIGCHAHDNVGMAPTTPSLRIGKTLDHPLAPTLQHGNEKKVDFLQSTLSLLDSHVDTRSDRPEKDAPRRRLNA